MFLKSNIPEIVVFAILGDLGKTPPKDVAIAAAQRINALESGELRKKKFFKQLRIIANIRNLAPIIDKVMENITQYFVPERDPWYKKGVTETTDLKDRLFTSSLLLKTDFSVDKIANLVGVSTDYVEILKKELIKVQSLLKEQNSIKQIAQLLGVSTDYIKKIKAELDSL